MLSDEGKQNLKLLKNLMKNKWENNVVIINESKNKMYTNMDVFEIQLQIYRKYKVLIEYETGTFAIKIWDKNEYKYMDSFTNDKIVYGFDSMIPKNIIHNFKVLDRVLSELQQS